jgi:hypothetical protein
MTAASAHPFTPSLLPRAWVWAGMLAVQAFSRPFMEIRITGWVKSA